MRVFALTFSVYLFFSSSLQALPQGHREEIQPRKWADATAFYDVNGRPYVIKAFLTANEKCGDIRELEARIQCYRDFNILPQKAESFRNDEVEMRLENGWLIRTTEETYCTAREMAKKNQPLLSGPCHAVWEELIRQKNGPTWFCKKVRVSPAKKEERCHA